MRSAANYKRITHAQLQSFCETAARGSMTSAAAALEVAQPTIWKQIHSLEKSCGMTLIEPHTRGCRLTEAGQVLLRLAKPAVEQIETLLERFQLEQSQQPRRLTVCATPRPFDEELLPCVTAFEQRFPKVRLVLQQVAARVHVLPAVQSGTADVGLVSLLPERMPDDCEAEPLYELEPVLLVPYGHPLSQGRIKAEHLREYPLLNTRTIYADWGIAQALARMGAFDHPERRLELEMARSIRLYVQSGFGIGIVVRPRGTAPIGDVIERPLDKLFNVRMTMYALYRRHNPTAELVQDFIVATRAVLQTRRPRAARR